MKKLLALVLALVMTMSLVTISNAAFSDAKDIEHTEAVEVMNALGVIAGMPDGSFAPKGNVTRAQMAKMITIIMLGDVDAAAFVGTTTDLTDISGHWAEGYIKYCYSQGVIAGKGNGIFDPDANVTAVEAAKMLLVAIGYNAEVQGYVGGDWAINVIRDAQLSNFFDELSVTSTKVLTRDEAAQMIYNAINADTIDKNPSINISNGQVTYNYTATGDPLMETTFKAYVKYAYLTGVNSYDETSKKYTYSYSIASGDFGDAITDDALAGITVKSTADYSELFGQKVKVVYKTDKNNTIYGIYSDADILVENILGNVTAPAATAEKVKIDSVEYKLNDAANTIKVYEFLAGSTVGVLSDVSNYFNGAYAGCGPENKAFTGKLIDNDGDGKGDVIVVYPFAVEKVTYVGTKSFTTSISGTEKFEDVTVYDGIAKDDYVKVTAAVNTANDTAVYEKLDLVEATSAAVKVSDGKIKFGDTWYKTDVVGPTNAKAGEDCEYVEVNGYLFYLDASTSKADVSDFAIVTNKAAAVAGLDSTLTVKLLKSDGTKETVEVSKVAKANGATTDAVTGSNVTVGGFYKLDEDDDGYTVLIEVSKATVTTTNSSFDVVLAQNTDAANQSNKLSTMTFTGASGSDDGYFTKTSTNAGDYYIDDDAVVFVYNTDGSKYSVTTGAKLKDTKSATVTETYFAAAVNNDDTNYNGIVVVYVKTGSSITAAADTYGYVVDDVTMQKNDDDKYYVTVKFWDGENVVTLNTKASASKSSGVVADAYGLAKKAVFKYDLNADGDIEKIYSSSDFSVTKAAVTAYNGKNIQFSDYYFTKDDGTTNVASGSESKTDARITNDTVIIYVSNADKEGAEGGSIQLANENVIKVSGIPVTSNYANVAYNVNGSNEVVLLVVDVNNDYLDIQ